MPKLCICTVGLSSSDTDLLVLSIVHIEKKLSPCEIPAETCNTIDPILTLSYKNTVNVQFQAGWLESLPMSLYDTYQKVLNTEI